MLTKRTLVQAVRLFIERGERSDLNANCDLSRQLVCEALPVGSTISTNHRIVCWGGLAK